MPRACGVTLVELLVTLVIIAVLAAIGLPSYRGFMQRSQRTEAKEALVHLAANQEKFYLESNTYTADLGALGLAAATENGLYALAVTAADRQGFTATAVPAPGSRMLADDDCLEFGINEARDRIAAPDPRGDCW